MLKLRIIISFAMASAPVNLEGLAQISKFSAQANFCVEIEDKLISFVYTRKCACSTLKKLIELNYPDKPDFFEFKKNNLLTNSDRNPIYTIFFYRDPMERLLSCVGNKLIQQRWGAASTIENVTKALKKDIDRITFDQLCREYLPQLESSNNQVDLHFRPQIDHLLPITYTHSIHISSIYNEMVKIIGNKLSNSAFQKPINRTTSATNKIYKSEKSISTLELGKVRELSLEYNIKSILSSLRSPETEHIVEKVYRNDYKLLERINSPQEI